MPVILTALLVTSCASQKRAWYLQDAQPFTPEQIAENGQIRIKPLDRLTIVVNSKDPELAVPFNSSSSLSSLTGATNYGSATNQSLQIRTVDENGQLEMPVIGKIECKGKTRSELAQAIADKIVEGGYINDPTVNVQFADMKISVIGEVARPGHYDVTRDKLSIFDALAMAGDRRSTVSAPTWPWPAKWTECAPSSTSTSRRRSCSTPPRSTSSRTT